MLLLLLVLADKLPEGTVRILCLLRGRRGRVEVRRNIATTEVVGVRGRRRLLLLRRRLRLLRLDVGGQTVLRVLVVVQRLLLLLLLLLLELLRKVGLWRLMMVSLMLLRLLLLGKMGRLLAVLL